MGLKEYARNYLEELKASIDNLPLEKIEAITKILRDAYENDGQVFVVGNGGRAATASHFVCDLAEGTLVLGKKRFKVIGLTDNIPLMTAWSNDSSHEDLFEEQLVNLLNEGDVVVGISAGGNSPNILKAIHYANSRQAITIGLTGFVGGKLKDMARVSLIVSNDNMEQIEDIHLILIHLIKSYLKEALLSECSIS